MAINVSSPPTEEALLFTAQPTPLSLHSALLRSPTALPTPAQGIQRSRAHSRAGPGGASRTLWTPRLLRRDATRGKAALLN